MMSERLKYSLLFALLARVFFLPFNGNAHLFDWDEVNFAEISREMVVLKDYLRVYINYLPFWEKPPFFFWAQALAMNCFGINEFSARLPNAICGIVTLIVLFNIGKTLYNTRFGIIWALAYFGSVLPHLYFKSGIIDPYLNLFIFLGMYYFILAHWKKNQFDGLALSKGKWRYLFIAGMFVGLSLITKGPVALIITGLCMFVYWIFQRFRMYINVPEFLFYLFITSLITLTWYGIETWKNGPWFVEEFNKYQYRLFTTHDAGHKGFPGYHFVVLLVGCFPASIFTIRAFFKSPEAEHTYQKDFKLWMAILFWVVLILFTIVQSKIVHYSSMCYYPLSFLAALSIHQIYERKISFNFWMKLGLIFTGGLFILVTFALPFVAWNIDILKPLFNDPFAVASLDAEVNWTGFEIIPGIFLALVLFFSLRWISRQQFDYGFRTLFLGTGVFVMITLIFYINRIEAYSQNAAIEFFKSKATEDCYVVPHGYKSYGQLFYTQKPPVTNPESYKWKWLMEGDIDKDVYVITKIQYEERLQKQEKNLKKVGGKNGFVFFKREK